MNSADTDNESSSQNECEEEERSSAMFSSLQSPTGPEHSHSLEYDEKLTRIKFQLQLEESGASTSLEIAHNYNIILEETNDILVESFARIGSKLQACGVSGTANYCLPVYLQGVNEVLQLLAPYLSRAASASQRVLPECAARILCTVFTHCKDSESLYGEHLSSVQSQLKELFSSCRALLLVYLDRMQSLTLDPHDEEQVAVLIGALYTNVEIGSVVVQLDVRTTADQWKALVALCEKHSECLSGGGVSGRCVSALAALVSSNLHSCVSDEHDSKSLQRSLKVTSFLMKIIIKMCKIFKCKVTDDYTQLVNLLIALKSNSEMYLRILNKPETLIQQIQSHITVSAEPLLAELMNDREFSRAVLGREVEGEEETSLLGLLLLLVSVMEALLARDEPGARELWLGDAPPDNVLCFILNLMPHCHVWLNGGARLECRGGGACGAYEAALSRACALAATAERGQHAALRRGALAALLRADCWAAALAADMCVALARYSTAELCIEQISQLIAVYKRVKRGASKSPQCVYLSVTIRRLFNTLLDEDKLSVLAAYPCRGNVLVWQAIGVRHLPEAQAAVESRDVFSGLRSKLERCCGEDCDENDFEDLIEHMSLAATCVPADVPSAGLVRLWLRCRAAAAAGAPLPAAEAAAPGAEWLGECALAASSLTAACCAGPHLANGQLVQILEALASIIAKSSSALKLSAIRVLTALSYHKAPDDAHTDALRTQITTLFRKLLTDDEPVVTARAMTAFELFCHHSDHRSVILGVVINESMKESLIHFIKFGEMKTKSQLSWMEQLRLTSKMKFTHKCKAFEGNFTAREADSADNFEMPDIESLFDDSDIEDEPASKKMKANSHEVDSVLCRLEKDALLLDKIKENALSKEESVRITKIIDRLQNILS